MTNEREARYAQAMMTGPRALMAVADAEIASQVEAAVSAVRAEVEQNLTESYEDGYNAALDESAEADLRALREGLEALADRWASESSKMAVGIVKNGCAVELRALLAPSPAPAEGTGEGDAACQTCGHERRHHYTNDGCYECGAERLAKEVTPDFHEFAPAPGEADDMCPNCVTPWKCNGPHRPAPVSSGEADKVHADFCAPSQHVRGKVHSWKFDGDDPYIECHYCHEMRDARTGRLVRPAPVVTPSAEDGA